MYTNILIPTDGSRLSEKAIKQGVALARALGAKVTGFIATPSFKIFTLDPVMSTDTPERYKRDSRKFAQKALETIKTSATAEGLPCSVEHVVAHRPFEAIIRAVSRNGCDLIFMASHGRKGVSAVLLGSETSKVLTHSKTPVLVCR